MNNKETNYLFIYLMILGLGIILGIGLYVTFLDNSKTQDKVNEINKKVSTELVDLGYNIETNQSMWKFPNESIWKVLE